MVPGSERKEFVSETLAARCFPRIAGIRNEPGPFDISHASNQIVADLLQYSSQKTIPVSIVEHPQSTITCQEKADLFRNEQQYEVYGELRVAKGTLLTWKQGELGRFVVVMSNGESRIDFKEIKKVLNLSNKTDLTMYRGDVETILGLERGGVSALIEDPSKIDMIYFDQSLVVKSLLDTETRWDFAFSSRHSVFIAPVYLMDFLGDHHVLGSKVRKFSPELPQIHD